MMGRPKKNHSQTLVSLVVDFYEQEACGNPSKLRFTALAAYARSRGYEAEAYDFRRDAAVREKIDEITARQETQSRETMTAAYRNIDLDALFRHCPDLETLKRNIHGLDDYWRRVYEEMVEVKRENDRLRHAPNHLQEMQALQETYEQLQEEMDRLKSEHRQIQDENAYLRRFLRNRLYPAVAEELLRQENLPVPENKTVKPTAFDTLIEGNSPQTFSGAQGEPEKKESRQERLLNQMKEQIDKR